eukprot:2132524-Pleurochrysis_carterae.AAC.1
MPSSTCPRTETFLSHASHVAASRHACGCAYAMQLKDLETFSLRWLLGPLLFTVSCNSRTQYCLHAPCNDVAAICALFYQHAFFGTKTSQSARKGMTALPPPEAAQ